jgi:uncharacterized protein (DUF433 family)
MLAGTRVPVEVVVGELAGGSSFEETVTDYHPTHEQILAALGYATHILSLKRVHVSNYQSFVQT